MDEHIAKWVIEFLLRKPIDDRVINRLISHLPLANDDNRLKKSILLRKIEFDSSNGSVSEKLLDLFEIIEELDYRDGKTASNSMKEAYCAIAVDCTVKFLEKNVEKNGNYFEAVKRVWRNRVCKMEGLVSEESNSWFGEIEAAVWDSDVCEKILMRNTRNEALMAIRVYLKEAWGSLGSTFLELAAEKIMNDPCSILATAEESQKCETPIREKLVPTKSRWQSGAKISDANEKNEDESLNKVNDVSTSQVENPTVREIHAPRQSNENNLEKKAEKNNNFTNGGRANEDQDPRKQENLPRRSLMEPNGTAHTLEWDDSIDNLTRGSPTRPRLPRQSTTNDPENARENEVQDPRKHENLPMPSLMEPNVTDHTLECVDSMDNSTKGSPSRARLPSPKVRKLSPLRKVEDVRFVKRRARRAWTPLEEDTLRSGVQKFGKGNWKWILHCHSDIFQERTEVDLKDKWRNMTRNPYPLR